MKGAQMTTETNAHDPRGEMGISPIGFEEKLVVPPDPDNMGVSPLLMLEELRRHKPEPSEHSDI